MRIGLVGAVLVTLMLAGCSDSSDDNPPGAAEKAAVDAVTSTTVPGTDHLDAPDVGCIARADGLAIDYTGGASDLADAIAVQFPLADARVVSANERYAWVVSTESEPPQRAQFYDGGSGWALLRIDRCCPNAGARDDSTTAPTQSGPGARIDAPGDNCVRS